MKTEPTHNFSAMRTGYCQVAGTRTLINVETSVSWPTYKVAPLSRKERRKLERKQLNKFK